MILDIMMDSQVLVRCKVLLSEVAEFMNCVLFPGQVARFVGRPVYDRFHFDSPKSHVSDISRVVVHAVSVCRSVFISEHALPRRDDAQW